MNIAPMVSAPEFLVFVGLALVIGSIVGFFFGTGSGYNKCLSDFYVETNHSTTVFPQDAPTAVLPILSDMYDTTQIPLLDSVINEGKNVSARNRRSA